MRALVVVVHGPSSCPSFLRALCTRETPFPWTPPPPPHARTSSFECPLSLIAHMLHFFLHFVASNFLCLVCNLSVRSVGVCLSFHHVWLGEYALMPA